MRWPRCPSSKLAAARSRSRVAASPTATSACSCNAAGPVPCSNQDLSMGSAPGLIQPLDRRDAVAGGLDARDRLLRTLDGRGHVMRVGMDDSLAIAGDRDMAFPENQIAAFESLRVARVEFAAEPLLLHVAVARAAGAGGGKRNLHEPRTIDPKTALAAP